MEPAFSSAVVEVGDGGLPEIAGVVQVAVAELPEVRATAPHPEIVVVVAPVVSSKSIVPVGVPEPGELDTTVAVKVTCWPVTEGFTDEVIVVVVVSWFTVWMQVPVAVEVEVEQAGRGEAELVVEPV
ncbi:MAG: hypothetical protein M1456_01305 [Actinobacteria bacterium]|nr:hypothetical protein [Actinomycetota bacterium]